MANSQNLKGLNRVLIICVLCMLVLAIPTYMLGHAMGIKTGSSGVDNDAWTDFWVFRLSLNLLGYAVIIVPGYLLIRYVKRSGYIETAGTGPLSKIIKLFVYGNDLEKQEDGTTPANKSAESPNFLVQFVKLAACVTWLLTSYLAWGMLQERIMAFEYGASEGVPGERFKDSQFLVFMNRIWALCLALLVVWLTGQGVCHVFGRFPQHTAPLYVYSYSSFSNIMSSWCQYEALKFVNFPMQVLAKSCKVIPVMLMGKIVSGTTYKSYEYITAVLISLGVFVFVWNSPDVIRNKDTTTTFSGIIILIGYLLFDAFTSNWQGQLFKTYKMSSFQMMAGVNFFSTLFTATTLLEQGGFVQALEFMGRHPTFFWHVFLLSICSAFGQVAIFYTISEFGPVVFTIIMTTRQGFSILLSCVFYGHPLNVLGVFGVIIVFVAVFSKTYLSYRDKQLEKAAVRTRDVSVA